MANTSLTEKCCVINYITQPIITNNMKVKTGKHLEWPRMGKNFKMDSDFSAGTAK